jgi:hypothetical protein
VIDRDEIDATSRLLGVHASDVQRDYLYGWLLAGYFASIRFCGDLDFAAPAGLHPGQFARRAEQRLR